MIWTTIFYVIAVLIAALVSYYGEKKYLKIAFGIVFIHLAIRFDYGNDYMSYMKYFDYVQEKSLSEIINFANYDNYMFKEFGYTILNKIFPSFYILIAALSLFTCYVYHDMLFKHAADKYIWFSLFILLFDPNIMLIQLSAIRQGISICIFVLSVRYLVSRKFWKYSGLIALGSLFHVSTLILLPIYFLATSKKWKNSTISILIACFVLIFFFGYIFIDSIESITQRYFPIYYRAYMQDVVGSELNTGLGFLFLTGIFLTVALSHNETNEYMTVFSKLSLIGFLFYPLGIYLLMFNRLYLYFLPFISISLTFSIASIKNWQVRIGMFIIILIAYSYIFYSFYQNPVWIKKFFTYKTIISSF